MSETNNTTTTTTTTKTPKTLSVQFEGKEYKILEGTVAWAREDIIDNVKNEKIPTSGSDLFQTWQAANCLGIHKFADRCASEMEDRNNRISKRGRNIKIINPR